MTFDRQAIVNSGECLKAGTGASRSRTLSVPAGLLKILAIFYLPDPHPKG
jgi:hypothetical protein